MPDIETAVSDADGAFVLTEGPVFSNLNWQHFFAYAKT